MFGLDAGQEKRGEVMEIYVAAKYQDRDRVRELYYELSYLGHEITVDWTNHNDVSPEKLTEYAVEDVGGVKEAKLLIALMTIKYEYKGLWVEMGIALGKGIPVWVIGDAGDSCLFMNHPLVRKFNCISEVLKELT